MMKTTTSNSMRVKARRDAWDIGGAGREDSSSIGFDGFWKYTLRAYKREARSLTIVRRFRFRF